MTVKRWFTPFLGFIVLTASAVTFGANISGKLLPISNNGIQLQDSSGRLVILHGLDVINKQAPYEPSAAGFNEKDAEFLQRYGFNLVRLGVTWSAIEPHPSKTYNDKYLANIKSTVDMLARHGIYTVIDFHQDGYSARDNLGVGFPNWASLGRDKSKKAFNPGFPFSYEGGKKFMGKIITHETDNNFTNFWKDSYDRAENVGLQEAYAKMLTHSVAYFKGDSSVIGYEVMNEPFIGDGWQNCVPAGKPNSGCYDFDTTVLQGFSSKMVAAIHQGDPNTIAWVEPEVSFGMGTSTYLSRFNQSKVGFSFHDYHPDITVPIQNALNYQGKTNMPLLMTEFGAASANSNQLKAITSLADMHNLSWSEWAYFNNPVFKFPEVGGHLVQNPIDQGIVLHDRQQLVGQNIHWDRLNILSRPYPQAVAGSNVHFKFDPDSAVFTLSYQSHHPIPGDADSTVTTVVVPGVEYSLLRAQVAGATLVSHIGNVYTFKNSNPGAPVTINMTLKAIADGNVAPST